MEPLQDKWVYRLQAAIDAKSLKAVNCAMAGAVFILFLFWAFRLFGWEWRPSFFNHSNVHNSNFHKGIEFSDLKLRDLTWVEEAIGAKYIFKSGSFSSQNSAMTSSAIMPIASEPWTLVGIIPGPSPKAIFEDKDTKKTHYLSKGDRMGLWQVEAIANGSVKLDRSGEKKELTT